MAKRKDDVSFSFTSKKAPKKAEPAAPAETPTDESGVADPFASAGADSSGVPDPFATADSESSAVPDPFASSDNAVADPFASSGDGAAADPFASSTDSGSVGDPFASGTDAPADAGASDPFASTESAPADAPAEASAETPEEEAPEEKTPQVREHKQFRILVLADFSGRTNRGIMEPGTIASRKVHPVDADNLDRTVAKVKPALALPVDEKSVVGLSFGAMEDFRPDALLKKIEAFTGMLELREKLRDAKKFKEAAAAVRKLTGTAAPKKPKAKGGAAAGGGSDFERLLNQPIAPKGATEVDAQAFIANLVGGYGVPEADPEQGKMVKLVEDALSAGLRAVLRHPAFQGLEGAWRGVEFLVSRLNTDEDLKICILDVSKEELYADLAGPPVINKTGMYQVLVEQTHAAGAVPYSLVVADYEFDQSPQNIALLAKLATLMHEAGIPVVAGASPKVAGFESFAKFPDSGKWQPPADIAMWEKIRGHKLAAHVGLAAPRFLLRLPYGPKTDAIETYGFEEMPGAPVTEGYLWGNGAFAVALAIGQGFLDSGWQFEPVLDVTDLPCHMAVVDGDKEMTPCAQGWLSDRIGEILHQLGLIPLLSVRNAASVKIAGVHSIAKGGKALAAEWAAA